MTRERGNKKMEKPRFRDLYTTHHVSAEHLAAKAGVQVDIIDRMLTDRRVFQGQAEKVLSAFAKLTGETYTLDTVYVPLQVAELSEVNRIQQEIMGEYLLARHAKSDFVEGMAKHAYITKRMEGLQKGMSRLVELVGEDQTMDFFKAIEGEPKEGENTHA